MAAAIPEYDFLKCATPWLVNPGDPVNPQIGDGARLGDNVFGLVYATHPTNANLAYIMLSGGYGHTVAAAAASGNSITQGEKMYVVDATATARPTYTNASSGNVFAGYAMPANEVAAATSQLVAANATGNIMLWVRPE